MDRADLVGSIGGTVICGALVWYLNSIKNEWPLISFLELCLAIVAAGLLAAWLMDRRRQADSE